MPDLRNDLDRLAGHAGEPVSFDDLASARRRRERRRRAEGLVVGLAVIAAAAVFLATTFRSDPSGNVPGESQPAVSYAPPTVPYLWPESWLDPAGPEQLASVQAAIEQDDPGTKWRTVPGKVVDRFVSDVLGWDGSLVAELSYGWEVTRTCQVGDGSCDAEDVLIYLTRPAGGNAWSVRGVITPKIGTGPSAIPDSLTLAPGDPLPLRGRADKSLVFGFFASNGCSSTGESRNSGVVDPMPAFPEGDGCGPTGPGYMFAYTTESPNPQRFDVFDTGSPITALTLLPFVLDGSASSPTIAPAVWATYTDPLGWTIDVPVAWTVVPIDRNDGQLIFKGAVFASAEPIPEPLTPTAFNLPPGEISLQVENVSGAPYECGHDDSAFPLSYQEFVLPPEADNAGDLFGTFTGHGCRFSLSGNATDATPQQTEILRRMVESIRFELDPSAPPQSPSVVTPSGSGDQAVCLAAPTTDISIVGSGVELSGCTQWAADHRLTIDFEVGDAVEMRLELRDEAGSLIWSTPIITGPDSYSFGVPALDRGQYVLTDPIHPVSARLEISVGSY